MDSTDLTSPVQSRTIWVNSIILGNKVRKWRENDAKMARKWRENAFHDTHNVCAIFSKFSTLLNSISLYSQYVLHTQIEWNSSSTKPILKGIIPSRATIFRHMNHVKQTTQTFGKIALYFINNDTLTLILSIWGRLLAKFKWK